MNILMFLSQPWETDPRVSREKDVLEKQGHTVMVHDWRRTEFVPWKTMMHLPQWQRMAYRKYKDSDMFDVVHCHDFDTLRVGVRLKKQHSDIRLVYDAHEMYGYMTGLPVRGMERRYLKYVDQVVAANESIKEYLQQLGAEDVMVIRNCKPCIYDQYVKPDNDVFTVGYFGCLRKNRMFPLLFHVVARIPQLRMVFAGNGMDVRWLPDNVDHLPFLSEMDMYEMMRGCDALICMFDPSNLNCRYGTPNKLFEALMVGRPLVCTYDSVMGEFVREHDVGVSCTYAPACVRVTLSRLRDDPDRCELLGRNAFRLASDKFNWEMESSKLREVYA